MLGAASLLIPAALTASLRYVFMGMIPRESPACLDVPGGRNMDFSLDYTEEQEQFRKEVQAWLDENAPKVPVGAAAGPQGAERGDMVAPRLETEDAEGNDFRRKLGEKGWIAPTYPADYGGGGLTDDHASIIHEKMRER